MLLPDSETSMKTECHLRFLRSAVIAALPLFMLAGCGGSDAVSGYTSSSGSSPGDIASSGHATLYVSATAPDGGNGTRSRPFNTLAALQQASAPGDTLVVLASPDTVAPLDGGIALKPGQRLIGENDTAAGTAAPRITNSSDAAHSGDAVDLADGAEVANLTIVNSYRVGIYGLNVTGISVHDNNVSGQNISCAQGFIVPSDTLPTVVPGVTIPFPVTLPNGWAGIMVDADHGSGSITISDNTVHDASCGDGIDVRMKGTANYRATIDGNTVFNLQQGPASDGFESVLAIGMQTRDSAQLTATLDNNTEHDIGSPPSAKNPIGADSEGVFANVVDASTMQVDVDHNSFYHGIGGWSANGMEMPVMGSGGTAIMRIRNSSFTDVPGDVLEMLALGTDGTLQLELDNVTASYATGGTLQALAGPFASANVGNCLAVDSSDAGNSLQLTMRNSTLSDCYHDGVDFGSNTLLGATSGKLIGFDIENSRIMGNKGYGLRVVNSAPLTQLSGKVASTNFSGNQKFNVAFDDNGQTGNTDLDFGGGALGSAGGNCFYAGGKGDAESEGYSVFLESDWWGGPAGPAAGSTRTSAGGSLHYLPVLTTPPPACQ